MGKIVTDVTACLVPLNQASPEKAEVDIVVMHDKVQIQKHLHVHLERPIILGDEELLPDPLVRSDLFQYGVAINTKQQIEVECQLMIERKLSSAGVDTGYSYCSFSNSNYMFYVQ